MTSEQFIWVWLPGASEPVVCGRVWQDSGVYLVQYGRSYLSRSDAVPLFGMPLGEDVLSPPAGMTLHGALRDGLPDAWGQHVILARMLGRSGRDADPEELDALAYMRESNSDRFGAVDFQASPTDYLARQEPATLDDLADAARALEEGRRLPPSLDAALTHGTSIGGARPKATLVDGDRVHWIAKFSSTSDGGLPRVRHEALGLHLARAAGVVTVDGRLATAADRDVLLVRRFDRRPRGTRVMAVSGLTMLALDEMVGRYATYPEMLDVLRAYAVDPEAVGHELFRRIAVNIVLGNTDDHARNHAALWDGRHLVLSPAYDIDPCRSPGWDANQAMAYGREGERRSNLKGLLRTAAVYSLNQQQARAIIDHVMASVTERWSEALDAARLTQTEGDHLLGSRVLNPAVLDGLS